MSASDEKALKPGDDLKMMLSPHLWPNWCQLPMKCYEEQNTPPKRFGVLFYGWDFVSEYYFVEEVFISSDPLAPMRIPEEKRRRLDTGDDLQKLLDEGWVVD